jgi:hypothetical protein
MVCMHRVISLRRRSHRPDACSRAELDLLRSGANHGHPEAGFNAVNCSNGVITSGRIQECSTLSTRTGLCYGSLARIYLALSCHFGRASLPAAVGGDPVSGTLTVYVGGGDSYLYALDAATGAIVEQLVVQVITKNSGYVRAHQRS